MRYYKPMRAIRKTWLRLSSELEKGHEAERHFLSVEDLVIRLESFLEPLWTNKDPSGRPTHRHIRTGEYDSSGHYLHAQSRTCQAFQDLYLATREIGYMAKAQSLADYLVTHQEENGLFLAHRKSGYPRDEGIATYWAVVTLINMSRLSGDHAYLDAAIRGGDAGRVHLFGESYGYAHTIGQKFWTPNASGGASLAYKLLYEATSEERYHTYVTDGLKHVVGHLNEEGMFEYCEKRTSIYLSSYHALVTYFLFLFKGSQWDEAFSVSDAFQRSLGFLEELTQKDGSIIEPDVKYESSALSLAISAAVYTKIGKHAVANKLIAFLGRFFTSNRFYLFEKQNKLYYGRFRPFYNYFVGSVLAWLSLILVERNQKAILEQ